MPDPTFDFEAAYDDILIDDAAKTFVRRLSRKYGGWLAAACVVNIVGFVLVLVLPGSSTLMTAAVGFIAVLGPVYFPWAYRSFPGKYASAMRRRMKPAVHVSISSSSLSMSAKGHSFIRRWAEIKEIEEYTDYFLFVTAPLIFTFVPKKDIPAGAQALIREAALSKAGPAAQGERMT